MAFQKIFCLLFAFQAFSATPLAEQFRRAGYIEICDEHHEMAAFDSLYSYFDELIEFLQINPMWVHKLYAAKERFIRLKDRDYYSTDFFGFFDESKREGRSQIAFYYSTHFHEFIRAHYPELHQAPKIIRFLEICWKIQKPYGKLFEKMAAELGLELVFSSKNDDPPLLLKIVKYLPAYVATKPHYDGTVFSLFLNSTDNESLLLSPYKSFYRMDDFSTPQREFSQNSIFLIPGALLTEYSIYPTPHIATQTGKIRYATIAFAMRPNYIPQKTELSILPSFKP